MVFSSILPVAAPVPMGQPSRNENLATIFSFVAVYPLIESPSYTCPLCCLANLHEMTGWTEDLDQLLATWRRVLRKGVTGLADARIRRADGTFRWFLIGTMPQRDEHGCIVGWYGTNTDIEERQNVEKAFGEPRHCGERCRLAVQACFFLASLRHCSANYSLAETAFAQD